MNETLIINWNSMVQKTDEIYILGDFLYTGSDTMANIILSKLNGKKYLVKGNHEKYLKNKDFDVSAFEWIKDYHVLDYKDSRFILFHYPILEWQFYHRKSAHLYGHVHNNISHYAQHEATRFDILGKRAINVGVDCNNFYPISAETVYKMAFED
jgi:calcineurin-like phosphoesterase family protein